MMLYVYHVDGGRMMSFDMTVALSSVENLKDTIERLHGIPAVNIVLLASGGEVLSDTAQVSFYSAGTDTNPIFMFLTGDGVRRPSSNAPQTEADPELREQVERSMDLPAVYETVVTRAQLASKMHDSAREEERLCDRLVHDQHLQQQGWSAVVANMEDLTHEFRLRFQHFCIFFDNHLKERGTYLDLLQNFRADLSKLSRIPILPGLMHLAEAEFHGFDEYLKNDEDDDVFSRSDTQQESVVMAAATTDTDAAGTSETYETLSTSPMKKPKMIDHHTSDATGESENSGQQLLSTSGASLESTTNALTKSQSGNVSRRSTLDLLQWITSKGNHNALQIMSEECIQGLNTFNEEVYEKLKNEIQNIIKIAEQGDVKEIKGLGERLRRLDEFKYKIKNMVQDQKELSTAFQQNQNRAINLRDTSILPDLCASHRSQLLVMLQNHQKIREHRRCIAKAKDELGVNLQTRLKRIVCIENAMSDFDNRMLFHHRCLQRAERHIRVIEQIHQAPCMYVSAVTEVVRRKIFSEEFGKWASKLAEDFDCIHREEMERRETFNACFSGHFLNILFPGMNDMPPAFANENPLIFDARLPNLTRSDLGMLSSYLPELIAQIQLPDMRPVIRFFVSRSGEDQKERWEKMLKEEASAKAGDKAPQNLRLTELQKTGIASGSSGCDESETDTEIEFEKVPSNAGQQNIVKAETLTKSTSTEQRETTSAETSTSENEEFAANSEEIKRLRTLLSSLSYHAIEGIRLARSNLNTFRTDAEAYRDDVSTGLQSLQDTCSMLRMQQQQLLQEQREKELQLADTTNELKNCQLEVENLQEKLRECEKFRNFEMQTEEMAERMRREKETAVALAREQLIQEHKEEIESLRRRFKLMTSMERSVSDMSPEKMEKSERTSADNPPAIEMIRAQFEAEKMQAVNAAVEAERSMWQSKFALNTESVMANAGILKVIEEKERQLEQLRERELMLTKENCQLKTRLDALTNEDANSWLREKIEYLNRDKERLEKELEQTRRVDMEGSVAGSRGSTCEGNVLPRSKSNSSSDMHIVLQSLEKGDIVFVVWSTTYGQFIIVQDSTTLFFVHAESLPALKLKLPRRDAEAPSKDVNTPIPFYAIGIVVDKEYCQARKDENRYRVPRGSKFYRVKLAPITITQPSARVPRERLESLTNTVSRSVSQCESQSEASTSAVLATAGISLPKLTLGAKMSFDIASTSSASQVPNPVPTATNVAESIMLRSERCRYISVSEEDEGMPATLALQQQSVITEQPTASNKSKLDLMPTCSPEPEAVPPAPESEHIEKGPQQEHQQEKQQEKRGEEGPSTLTTEAEAAASVSNDAAIPSTTSGTGNEDSDEYRSLEGKEDETECNTFE